MNRKTEYGVKSQFPFNEVETNYTDSNGEFTSKIYYSPKNAKALLQDYTLKVKNEASGNPDEFITYKKTFLVNYTAEENGDVLITGIEAGKDYDATWAYFAYIHEILTGITTPSGKKWYKTNSLVKALTEFCCT